ncbi:hypothetical protein POJ06DRAFT_226964 [Lipomyces tetrasporus]|uniref:Replication protein A subunit n=1 Tax=Lipomyces tetrasporus TaxID=54092 RepID=A0AAD7QMC1_9ASCO|nr:uncharacterized protein POJ06DRAFT_226964 [Lipomyces tetrasporus]KAJ8097814.1 hypothetical protein POJ06DRAFT_226964 [Lipomyces tetrasporus]
MTMDDTIPLSRGFIGDMANLDSSTVLARHPTFTAQVLQIKELSSAQAGGPRRFRFVLSDGDHFVQCMLATQLNDIVLNNRVERGHTIKVRQYTPSEMKEKLVVILLDFEVLTQYGVRDKIGSPTSIDPKVNRQGPQPAQATYSNGSTGSTTFYGEQKPQVAPKVESTYSAAPSYGSAAPRPHNYYTIEGLSPYQNKWTIKARVTFKSEIKHWHNQRGEGKLFAVNLLDETGEIKATAFNDQVDQYYDLLQEGEVYYISKCRVNTAKKQFSNLQHDYELTFERDTEIEKCLDAGATEVPQLRFNFVENLGKLTDVQKDTIVDVMGVIKTVGDCAQITSKSSGRPYDKRDIVLVDSSGVSVQLTVWGTQAVQFSANQDDIVAVKGAKVSEFNGRSLSLLQSSTLTVNPDISEAHSLKGWFDTNGRNTTFSSLQSVGSSSMSGRPENVKTIKQIRDEQLGMQEQPDYFTVKGTVLFIRNETIAYAACPTEGCNKKLTDDGDGWRCEKCNKSFPEPVYRYILMFAIYDHSGQMWVSSFDDVGRVILGKPAGEYMRMRDEDNSAYLDEILKSTGKTYLFRVRAKAETYQNTTRPRYSAMSATPLNYAQESANLVKLIQSFDLA